MTSEANAVAPSTLSVVVGLGFTDADGAAFDQGARVARRVKGSQLHLVHVFSDAPSAEKSRDLVSHLRLYVNEKTAAMGSLNGMTVGIHLRTGKRVREIVQLATEVGAQLIVVGANAGPHLKSWFVGTTAEQLLDSAPCAVVVAPPKPKGVVAHDPVIEPPCPDCLRARSASGGKEWWCDRHRHNSEAGHTFSYQREIPLTEHDSEVIPTGIDF